MLKLCDPLGIIPFGLLLGVLNQMQDIVVDVVDWSNKQDNRHEKVDNGPSSCTDLVVSIRMC